MGLTGLLHKIPLVKRVFDVFSDAEARFHVGVLLFALGAISGEVSEVAGAFGADKLLEVLGGVVALTGNLGRLWEKLVNQDLNKDGRIG
jgi:hypothetical protein